MSKMSINYTPELVDEAIKEHIQKHMQVSGVVGIEYLHRRKTQKVSATVFVENSLKVPEVVEEVKPKPILPDNVPVDKSSNIMEVDDLENIPEVDRIDKAPTEFEDLPIGFDAEPIGFEDLPLHEQQEATDADEADVDSLFG